MRRPLCVFCATILFAQVVAVYLPQDLLLILAAIFAVCLFIYFKIKHSWYAFCIALGLVLGLILFYANAARNFAAIEPYLEESVFLTARVEDSSASYIEDMMSATIWVDSANGESVSFACYVSLMPEAEDGELIEGQFYLTALTEETNQLSNYSEGIFAQAEYQQSFSSIGYIGGFRGFFIKAQEILSRIIRMPFSDEVGGVLAAMTVGDRDSIPDVITTLFRKAGLSHVLVVSGLHLSLICSFVIIKDDTKNKRIIRAVLTMTLALFLAGITGATASILRAVLVLAICTLGSLLNEQSDSFTSLALAGFLLVASNGYLVCNLSFQLSFLSTFGVLLGATFTKNTIPYLEKWILKFHWSQILYTSILITLFASCATFPVLVLWDMNISLLAILSNLLTFWMIPFILLLGFAGAILGLVPFCGGISTWFLTSAAIFVSLLNKLVAKIALLPGAQLYFETEYAVYACLIIFLLGGLACYWKLRYRVVIPCFMGLFVASIIIGNYYMDGVIKITMLGTASTPAIVISQNQTAMVLFRGGEYNTQMVESYLEKRNITDLVYVIDMRISPTSECTLSATQTIWLFDTEPWQQSDFMFGEIKGTIFNANGGGVVLLDIGGVTLATTSGTVTLTEEYPVDILLATSSDAGSIVGEIAVCKGQAYAIANGYDAQNVYYGEDEASIWLRYGGTYKLWGVNNGE